MWMDINCARLECGGEIDGTLDKTSHFLPTKKSRIEKDIRQWLGHGRGDVGFALEQEMGKRVVGR